MSDETIVGVDAGGSKTLVALADRAGNVLRMTRGHPINPLDRSDWRQALEAQLRPFAQRADAGSIAAALPAYGEVEAISAEQRRLVAGLAGARPGIVLNDVDAAHIGAFAGGAGILILSGTGSMAWARDLAGKSYRVGGWGDAIGDEGSSHWIGRRVLETVTQSLDGRIAPTALVGAVFEVLGLDPSSPYDSIEGWVSNLTNARPQIAALAQVATAVAADGDRAAMSIIERAADELLRHITAIAKQSDLPKIWSYAGGTFRSALLVELVAAGIGTPPFAPLLPPIGGTLLAAARALDWNVTESWISRLAASIREAEPATV